MFHDFTKTKSDVRYNAITGRGIKILTSRQMLQRLPITLAHVKAGNIYENVLNEIYQVIFFLYWAKEIN